MNHVNIKSCLMLDACNAIAPTEYINIGQRPFQYVGCGRQKIVIILGRLQQVIESLDLISALSTKWLLTKL